MSCPECTKIYAQKRSRIVCLLSCCFCLGFHRIEKRNDIKEKQNVCNTHLPFHFSILCNYFAHENRNYPFCSPAFVLRFCGNILFPQVILTAFIQKINSYFAIYLIFHLIFSGFFPFLYIAVIFLWANRKRETAKAVSKESTRYKLQ